LRWVGKTGEADSGAATVVVGNLIAFFVCLPMAVPVGRFGAGDLVPVIYLGVFQVGLAYVFLTRSLRHVPGLEAATLLLVEPVFNPVWSWLVHGERPSAAAIAGGAVIIAAAMAGTWWQARAAAR
jgi:drug/metabolite transporter (DMT)-like permease